MSIDVIQGERKPWTIDLTSSKTGKPFDLTGNTEIKVCFQAGSTTIELLKTLAEVTVVGLDELGQISGELTTTQSDSLTPTTEGNIEVHVTFGAGDVRKAQLINAFTVTAKIC